MAEQAEPSNYEPLLPTANLGAPPTAMGAPVATLGGPGTTPRVLVAALEAPTVALGTPVGTLGAAVIAQRTPEPVPFIPAVSLATPSQSMGMECTSRGGLPLGGMASGRATPLTATQPSSPAHPDVNVSDASIPATPVQSGRHIQHVKRTTRVHMKRKATLENEEEEESRLFCSWLKSDTAKNETKTSLMALKQEKVRLEIMKLKRQLMVD